MSPAGWRAVDSFASGGLFQGLEVAVADAGLPGERFQSDAGECALLLPVGPLAEGRVPGIAITGAPPEATEVLFLDPADAAGALDLLAALGGRARGVRVALPGEAGPGGLVPEAGRVVVTAEAEPPQAYRLARATDPARLDPMRPADAPRLGEDADVLDQRSKWFRSREGRGD
jgi:hypothetical protein